MLKAGFGEQTVGRTQVLEWLSKSRRCVTSVEDAEHSGHSPTSKRDENVDRVKDFVLKNCWEFHLDQF
jgi:hypothetical protein